MSSAPDPPAAGSAWWSRRRLLASIIGLGSSLIGVVFTVPAIGYLISPALKKRPARMVRVGSIDDIEPNKMMAVRYERVVQDGWMTVKAQRIVYVEHASPPRALSAVCTHLGCNVKWVEGEQLFKCPCHAGIYDRDGNVVSGPPPRPLDRLSIEVRGGEIYVEEA